MRRMMLRQGFLFLLLSATPAFGQRIMVKTPVTPGNLVILEATDVQESRIVWDIRYPDDFEQFAERGKELFLAMPKEKIGFTLLVIPNDVTKPIKKIRYTLEPNQEPEPEPEPEPELGKIFDPILAEMKPEARALAPALGKNFRIMAGKMSEYPRTREGMTDMSREWSLLNVEVTKRYYKDWSPFYERCQKYLLDAGLDADLEAIFLDFATYLEGKK